MLLSKSCVIGIADMSAKIGDFWFILQCIPQRGFGSDNFVHLERSIVYTVSQSADPNPFRVTHCINIVSFTNLFKESVKKGVRVFDLLLFLARYSSKENSQVVASKERWPGDLLPETL